MYYKNEISNYIHHKCGLCNSFKKSDFLVYFKHKMKKLRNSEMSISFQ